MDELRPAATMFKKLEVAFDGEHGIDLDGLKAARAGVTVRVRAGVSDSRRR